MRYSRQGSRTSTVEDKDVWASSWSLANTKQKRLIQKKHHIFVRQTFQEQFKKKNHARNGYLFQELTCYESPLSRLDYLGSTHFCSPYQLPANAYSWRHQAVAPVLGLPPPTWKPKPPSLLWFQPGLVFSGCHWHLRNEPAGGWKKSLSSPLFLKENAKIYK